MHTSLSHRAARVALAAFTAVLLAGCETSRSDLNTAPPSESDGIPTELSPTADLATSTQLGGPLANLGADDLARFNDGKEEFEAEEDIDEGLGPVFNEAACATCHNAPLGGTTGRAETRFGRTVGGVFDPLANLGGSLIQDQGIGLVHASSGDVTYAAETVPTEANVTTLRVTTPLFGLGLVDAVPDDELLRLARIEGRVSPSTRGVPNMVTEIRTGATRVGRFGWKAQVPTLHQFAGDAYLNEMGITSPEFPNENCPQGNCAALAANPAPGLNDAGDGVEKFADFMTLLGPPPRGAVTAQTLAGRVIFLGIGCANCHTPVMVTGDSPIPALSRKAFQPYSDFLLHDMGSLGDGITQNHATGRLMRTAPLWGVRKLTTLLHDGRATTLAQAILAHDGQARRSRDRFARLSSFDKAQLLAFLNSL